MRDDQSITKFDSHYCRQQCYYNRKSGAFGWCENQGSLPGEGTTQYPVMLKGRDESQIGPRPYTTPYYGFRFRSQVTHNKHEWHVDRKRYFIGSGWWDTEEMAWELSPLSWNQILGSNFTYFVEGGKDGYKPNVSAETRARAIRIANSKLRSDSINIGQTIGEMPEAVKEFSKLALGVLRTINALRKGNLRMAKTHLTTAIGRKRVVQSTQGISNTYLFYRFGVAPILNDINNMTSEIGKAMSQPDFLSVKGQAHDNVEPSGGSWQFDASGSLQEICEVGYKVRPKAFYAAAFLGLTNPIALAWELVPMSFIINWFISIGDTLNALDAGVGLEFVDGYITTVVKGKFDLNDNNHPGWNQQGKYEIDAFAMERAVLGAPAIPPISIKTSGLNAGQLLTIGAILLSSVKSNNLEKANAKDYFQHFGKNSDGVNLVQQL
jgi:hypothetical protein